MNNKSYGFKWPIIWIVSVTSYDTSFGIYTTWNHAYIDDKCSRYCIENPHYKVVLDKNPRYRLFIARRTILAIVILCPRLSE